LWSKLNTLPGDPSFRLIVFDLDGTLVDTRQDLAEATNVLIAELGGRALDETLIGGMVGQGISIWLERALTTAGITPFPPNAVERFSAIYDAGLLNHTRPYEGIPEMLQSAASKTQLAVLTNKMRRATIRILEGLDLAQYFAHVGGVDGPYPPKPAPDGMYALMKDARASASQTILVGDSPIDMHTARNAGTRICVACYGFGYVEPKPAELLGNEFFINKPGELTALLGGR
jgi:phosphoglycolate phosphatase